MRYKYKVCKGQKVLALSTTLREAEDEAKRVGGSVVPVGRKNPEYSGLHQAPDPEHGAPIWDLSTVYPDDVYGPKARQYYGTGENADRESFAVVRACKGRKTARVHIYRAVPPKVKAINVGDWVTISRLYAQDHGEGPLQGDYRILSKTVYARDLFTNGDSIHEWGYYPQAAAKNPSDQTQSAAFKAWFGNSKVVDKNGKPLVVYHGTMTPSFTLFEHGVSSGAMLGAETEGFYFTDDYDYAHDYGTTVMSVYLSLQNPYMVPIDAYDHAYITSAQRAKFEAAGYDGMWKREKNGKRGEIVVFRPEQIKSATNNRGTFDPHDADIRNPSERTWIPPAEVAAEARQALALRAKQPESNKCCTPVGIARAKQLANRQPVSETTLRRMKAYFDRHAVDAKGKGWGVDSKGWQAWLAWGGDSGRAWCQKILRGL